MKRIHLKKTAVDNSRDLVKSSSSASDTNLVMNISSLGLGARFSSFCEALFVNSEPQQSLVSSWVETCSQRNYKIIPTCI